MTHTNTVNIWCCSVSVWCVNYFSFILTFLFFIRHTTRGNRLHHTYPNHFMWPAASLKYLIDKLTWTTSDSFRHTFSLLLHIGIILPIRSQSVHPSRIYPIRLEWFLVSFPPGQRLKKNMIHPPRKWLPHLPPSCLRLVNSRVTLVCRGESWHELQIISFTTRWPYRDIDFRKLWLASCFTRNLLRNETFLPSLVSHQLLLSISHLCKCLW